MRILLVLTCCVGLALFAGAAQPDDQDSNHGKKKGGGGNAPAAQVTTQQTGKVYKAGPGGGPHTQNFQQQSTVHYKGAGKNKWQGPVNGQTQTNVSGQTKLKMHNNELPAVQSGGNAAYKTKLGKAKFSSQTNATGGANVKF